jgi:3-phosphoshikimate 1-carboxyvinyltransferase
VAHDLIITPGERPLVGSVPVAADERITPLAILCASLASEPSELVAAIRGERIDAMIAALRQFNVAIDVRSDIIRVEGVGLSGWSKPEGAVDCGDASPTMELLAGVAVAQPFAAILVPGPSAQAVDLAPLAKPLRWRGGVIEGVFASSPGTIGAPLTVGPLPAGVRLSELEYDLGSAGGDLKAAVLLSGLYADGSTYLREPFVTCDHAERLLQALDVPLATAGSLVELDPAGWAGTLPGVHASAVGDAGAAAVLLAAATLVPGSRVSTRNTGLNPTRTGALYFLSQMGGDVRSEVHSHVLGEPAGVCSAAHAPLRAHGVEGEAAYRAASELGVLAALCARADGVSVVAAPLPRATSAHLVAVLRAFGVGVELTPAGLSIEGRPHGKLAAADLDARDDFDLGAASLLLGLLADGPTRVRRIDGLARRFPRAVGTLRALGADLRVEESAAAG